MTRNEFILEAESYKRMYFNAGDYGTMYLEIFAGNDDEGNAVIYKISSYGCVKYTYAVGMYELVGRFYLSHGWDVCNKYKGNIFLAMTSTPIKGVGEKSEAISE